MYNTNHIIFIKPRLGRVVYENKTKYSSPLSNQQTSYLPLGSHSLNFENALTSITTSALNHSYQKVLLWTKKTIDK